MSAAYTHSPFSLAPMLISIWHVWLVLSVAILREILAALELSHGKGKV